MTLKSRLQLALVLLLLDGHAAGMFAAPCKMRYPAH
jgi:hypothetical protein